MAHHDENTQGNDDVPIVIITLPPSESKAVPPSAAITTDKQTFTAQRTRNHTAPLRKCVSQVVMIKTHRGFPRENVRFYGLFADSPITDCSIWCTYQQLYDWNRKVLLQYMSEQNLTPSHFE